MSAEGGKDSLRQEKSVNKQNADSRKTIGVLLMV